MLPSIEYWTTKEHGSEGPFPTNTRLAAAVTLRTGSVVVTGGRGGERDVWMSTVDTPVMWSRRQDMLEGRKGHAAVVVNIGSEDMVVVAGGGTMEEKSWIVFMYISQSWTDGMFCRKCFHLGWILIFIFRYVCCIWDFEEGYYAKR